MENGTVRSPSKNQRFEFQINNNKERENFFFFFFKKIYTFLFFIFKILIWFFVLCHWMLFFFFSVSFKIPTCYCFLINGYSHGGGMDLLLLSLLLWIFLLKIWPFLFGFSNILNYFENLKLRLEFFFT